MNDVPSLEQAIVLLRQTKDELRSAVEAYRAAEERDRGMIADLEARVRELEQRIDESLE